MRGLYSREGHAKVILTVIATDTQSKDCLCFLKNLALASAWLPRTPERKIQKYLERSEMSKVACGVLLNR